MQALIFDLDETLYQCTAFTRERTDVMMQYMCVTFGYARDEAASLRAEYVRSYGSTVKGLFMSHGSHFDVVSFGEYLIEHLDFGMLQCDNSLLKRLQESPISKKVLLTNNPRNYAIRVLDALGLEQAFTPDRIFGIDDTLPACKPERNAFAHVLRCIDVRPEGAVMIDDTCSNIRTARQMGMATAMVSAEAGVADATIGDISEIFDILETSPRIFMRKSIVVPCRRDSHRCKDKNLRLFDATSLLEIKLKELKKCRNIHRIIVSTDDPTAMELAEKLGVDVHLRDSSLCVGDVPARLVHAALASASDEVFIYCAATAPFVSHAQIDQAIQKWCESSAAIVCAAKVEKKFLWQDNQPLNFDMSSGLPSTDSLNDVFSACADAFLVAERQTILQTSCLFGDGTSIEFIPITDVQCTDVDYNSEFIIAESLWMRRLYYDVAIEHYMRRGTQRTKILDCTIRDAGYTTDWNWTYDFVEQHVKAMKAIGVDYCEVGFFTHGKQVDANSGPWRCLNENMHLLTALKKATSCPLAVMVEILGPNDSYCDVSALDLSGVSLVRVFAYRDTLDQAFGVCDKLLEKNVKVSVNIGHCTYLSTDDVARIRSMLAVRAVDFMYFADSHGMCSPDQIRQLVNEDYAGTNVGIHLHDNLGTAMMSAEAALQSRVGMLDATLSGIGKNGGNLSLEQIIFHLHFNRKTSFDVRQLLNYLESVVDVVPGMERSRIEWQLKTYMRVHSSNIPDVSMSFPKLFDYCMSARKEKRHE